MSVTHSSAVCRDPVLPPKNGVALRFLLLCEGLIGRWHPGQSATGTSLSYGLLLIAWTLRLLALSLPGRYFSRSVSYDRTDKSGW